MNTNNSAIVSWIGDTDMIDFYRSLSSEVKLQFVSLFPPNKNKERFIERENLESKTLQSPIKLILQEHGETIHEVHLITNRLAAFLNARNRFSEFLTSDCPTFHGVIVIHDCEKQVPRITELSSVYATTQEIISCIRDSCNELYCNISSGVGATSSALIMLSSAYFEKLHLLQTYQSTVIEDPLPENFSTLILKRSIKAEASLSSNKIIGVSPAIKSVLNIACKVAPFDYSVLLLGPSGTGKSTLAQEIHNLSHRKSNNFEYINCGSLTSTLLESKLYGHVKGAFTGATNDQDGVFKLANHGTIFLDEIADCSLELQTSLLHVLQPDNPNRPTIRHFRPVGGRVDEESDVRVIAATNKDIRQLIQEGKFREDLYYRLATTIITMPELTGREKDIEMLATTFLSQINAINHTVPGFSDKTLSTDALETLKKHKWAGNVRELQNVLQQATIRSDTNIITTKDLALSTDTADQETPDPGSFSIDAIKDDLERRYIALAITRTSGNKAMASRLLGMKTPQNLESRMRALNIRLTN